MLEAKTKTEIASANGTLVSPVIADAAIIPPLAIPPIVVAVNNSVMCIGAHFLFMVNSY